MGREHITTMTFPGGAKIKGGAKTFAISFYRDGDDVETILTVGKRQFTEITDVLCASQQVNGSFKDLSSVTKEADGRIKILYNNLQLNAKEENGKMKISLRGDLAYFFDLMKETGTISDKVISAVLNDEFYNLPHLIAETSTRSKSNTPPSSSASTADDNSSPRGLTHR